MEDLGNAWEWALDDFGTTIKAGGDRRRDVDDP